MNRHSHIALYAALLMVALMSGMLPHDVFAALSGEAELGYVNYEAQTPGTQKSSMNSLTQRYSLLYTTSGKFVGGRFGTYNVAMGYEWLVFDTDSASTGAQSAHERGNKGNFVYSGEVLIDPKELPLRLRLYSRDMNRSFFDGNSGVKKNILSNSLPGGTVGTEAPVYTGIDSGAVYGIAGGNRTESGAILIAGVKNGMTNGYNEVLRHFPMLMLDYRDVTQKDRNAINPVDNRLTRLAFISLNKKDNWFHYRYVTYNDYINPSQNYLETQVQLGTVDHALMRRWIDFSNWLKVSVDGQYTKRIEARSAQNFEEISLNLFGTARRQQWQLRTYNNFTRTYEQIMDRITYRTTIPLYASGIISPTANWKINTKYDETHTDNGSSVATLGGSYSVDSFNHSPFRLVHGVDAEYVNTSSGVSAVNLSGNISTASTRAFSRDMSLSAQYRVRSTQSDFNGERLNSIEHQLSETVRYNLTNKLYIMADQSNKIVSGSSTIISDANADFTPDATAHARNVSNYNSTTRLSFFWEPKSRLKFDVNLSEMFTRNEYDAKSSEGMVSAAVSYSDKKMKISSRVAYQNIDTDGDKGSDRVSASLNVHYAFNRSLQSSASVSYSNVSDPNKNSYDAIGFSQSLNYVYFQSGGMGRKLFEINESLTVSDDIYPGERGTNLKKRTTSSLLGVKYYPLRQILIAGGAKYTFENNFENEIINYYAAATMQFKLLEASVDYTYGKTKVDNRIEKKISANLKKRF